MTVLDFTPKQLERIDKEIRIVELYAARNPDGSRRYLPAQIAANEKVWPSTVWRIAARHGVAQSHAEANADITHLKRRSRVRRRREDQ